MKRELVLSCSVFCAVPSYGAAPTPQEVIASIESNGTQATREKYFPCGNKSKALGYARVETGSEKWLKIAVRLLKDSDGCYSLLLQDSIARALMNNPTNVLPLVDSERNLEAGYICVPFMADEVEPSKIRAQLATLDKLEQALNAVRNQTLQIPKNKCLALVKSMQRSTASRFPLGANRRAQ
jgi:hypothetical protein